MYTTHVLFTEMPSNQLILTNKINFGVRKDFAYNSQCICLLTMEGI